MKIMNFLLLTLLFSNYSVNAYLQTVTEQVRFKHSIENEIRSCSTGIIGKYPQRNRRTQIYSSDFHDSAEYPLKNSRFPIQGRVPSLLSRINDVKHDHFPLENFCLVEVANKKELETSLDFLYNRVHYNKCVINVFFHTNGGKILQNVIDKIWNKGYSMNVRFIVFMEKLNRTIVLGASSYVSPDTCKNGKLIEVNSTDLGLYCNGFHIYSHERNLFASIKRFTCLLLNKLAKIIRFLFFISEITININ